jgi:two-component system CheB/CheR fusion protein
VGAVAAERLGDGWLISAIGTSLNSIRRSSVDDQLSFEVDGMAKSQSTGARNDESGSAESGPLPLIVGIGASAGGLEAFKTFFSLMPVDSGMAFVLIQHLDPNRPSLLVDLLSTVTKMPVAEAADGTRVEMNHVYVIPRDATLTLEDDILRLSRPAPPRETRRPIDTFFVSLARAQGDNAVCIVLSGGGSDGSIGLTAIKEHGGLTLAQAEIDSQAKLGMPSSAAATGRVDEVLTVEQMPEKLLRYALHLRAMRGRVGADGALVGAKDSLAKIARIVRSVVGHDFSQYKEKTLTRRIQRRMLVLHLDAMDDYIDHLRKDPREVRLLFQEFLISVTEFFRDPEAFAALEVKALARLLEDKGADDQVRVWVSGCATGEEVYSIAILLKEQLVGRVGTPKIQIFATDIDEQAISQARAAKYRIGQLDGVSRERREKWFVQEGDYWCPIKDIRELCVFSVHSAIKDPPFSRLDLIVCRNLLIYLEPPAQDRLMSVFQYALKPRGYLFLGNSESVARQNKSFTTIDKKHRIFQRKDSPDGSPHNLANYNSDMTTANPLAARTTTNLGDRLDIEARRAMEKHAPAYVVVDARNDVMRFSGNVAKFLGPSPGAASLDLFALLQRPLRPAARAALQKVTRGGQAAVQKHVSIEIDGAAHMIDLIAEPVGAESGFCLLAFIDRGPPPAATTPNQEGARTRTGTGPDARKASNDRR